jgi:hypothetical protein
MRTLVFAGATIAALLASGAMIRSAEAQPSNPDAIRVAADAIGTIEKSQYVYLGRRHCWYPDGWHGPGWYWCGYNWRRGLGWGGPAGWRGWEWREERRERRLERRFERY